MREFHVPVVPGLRFHEGGWDYGGTLGKTSAYRRELGTVGAIWWEGPLKTAQDRKDLAHECGHAFLDVCIAPSQNLEKLRLFFPPHPATKPMWWSDMPDPNPATSLEQPLEEDFADAYANLAVDLRHRHGYLRNYLWHFYHLYLASTT